MNCIAASFLGSAERLRQFVRDFSKFKKALFAREPMRRPQGASCETLASPGLMAQRDGVFGRIEADLVGTGNGARAICAKAHRPLIAATCHLFRESQQGARWRIFFGSVMNLPAPRPVVFFTGKPARAFGARPPEVMKPNRKIWPPDDRRVLLDRQFADLSEFRKPARCPHDRRYAGFEQPTQVLRRRLGRGELD